MLTSTCDAWALRRLLAGHQLGAALRLVSATLRPLAGELEATAPTGRGRAYRLGLAALPGPDQVAIRLMVIDADPDGPPPAPADQDEEATADHAGPPARGGDQP